MSPSPFAGRDRAALRKHLSSYWKMEAGNVLLVPLIVWAMVWSAGDAPDAAMWLGAAACSFLLVVGTAAWLLVLAGPDGKPAQAAKLIAFCARAEIVSLLLLGAVAPRRRHVGRCQRRHCQRLAATHPRGRRAHPARLA